MKIHSIIVNDKRINAITSSLSTAEWQPYKVDGEFVGGRVHVMHSEESDGSIYKTGIWEHKPEDSPNGSFELRQKNNESIYVIEGYASVKFSDGTHISLQAGDLFYFPKGTEITWKTLSKVTKFFVIT